MTLPKDQPVTTRAAVPFLTSTRDQTGSAPPSALRRPGAGPATRLMALPQLQGGLPPTPEEIDAHLAALERARQVQLDALPVSTTGVVAAAHRGTVLRIIRQLRAARARAQDGTYGTCSGCSAPIQPDVLEAVPWQTTCPDCAHLAAR